MKQIPYFLFSFVIIFAIVGSLVSCGEASNNKITETEEIVSSENAKQSEQDLTTPSTDIKENTEEELNTPSDELIVESSSEKVTSKITITSETPNVSNEDEPTQNIVRLPANQEVYSLIYPLSYWVANVIFDPYIYNSSLGTIQLNTNEAVELSGLVASFEDESVDGVIQANIVETHLKDMFGSQFNISNYTNTPDKNEYYEYGSAFSVEYPNYKAIEWLHRNDDGNFCIDVLGTDDLPYVTNISIKDIQENEDLTCSAIVTYNVDVGNLDGNNNYITTTWSLDITYNFIQDESAKYNWAIQSFSLSDEYNIIENN